MYGYKGSELNSFAPSYEGFKMILVLVILLSKAVEAIESSAYWCWGKDPINAPANGSAQ